LGGYVTVIPQAYNKETRNPGGETRPQYLIKGRLSLSWSPGFLILFSPSPFDRLPTPNSEEPENVRKKKAPRFFREREVNLPFDIQPFVFYMEMGFASPELPLPVYQRRSTDQDLTFLACLAVEKEVSRIIIGLPRNMDGSLGEMANEVLVFVDALKEKSNLPVNTFDERLTSAEAERVLIQADLSRKRRKTLKDSLAAVLILQGYLESLKNV